MSSTVTSAQAIAHHAGLLLQGKLTAFGRLEDVWRSQVVFGIGRYAGSPRTP